jgi:hypothetical protein
MSETPENIYDEHLKEVQELFDSAVKELETIFKEQKDNHKNSLGTLKDILINAPLKNEFMQKYPPTNYILTDSDGNIKYVNPNLDTYVFKLYLDLYKKPDELIKSLFFQ